MEARRYLKPEKSIGVVVLKPIFMITKDVDQRKVTKNAMPTEIK